MEIPVVRRPNPVNKNAHWKRHQYRIFETYDAHILNVSETCPDRYYFVHVYTHFLKHI